MQQAIDEAKRALEDHMKRHKGSLISKTWAGAEFERLYNAWMRARWLANDPWVRSIYMEAP